jgi:hypothetical protein
MTAPVTDLTTLRSRRDAVMATHPSTLRCNGTRKGLLVAAALIANHELPDGNVSVWDEGRIVVLDYSGQRHAVGNVRQACQAIGVLVEELAAENPDGTAALELRGSDVQDGILRTVRAVVPVPTDWTVE